MADPRRSRSRSRRPARAVAALAPMLAPIAVAAAAYLTFVAGEDSGGPPAFPLAVERRRRALCRTSRASRRR